MLPLQIFHCVLQYWDLVMEVVVLACGRCIGWKNSFIFPLYGWISSISVLCCPKWWCLYRARVDTWLRRSLLWTSLISCLSVLTLCSYSYFPSGLKPCTTFLIINLGNELTHTFWGSSSSIPLLKTVMKDDFCVDTDISVSFLNYSFGSIDFWILNSSSWVVPCQPRHKLV